MRTGAYAGNAGCLKLARLTVLRLTILECETVTSSHVYFCVQHIPTLKNIVTFRSPFVLQSVPSSQPGTDWHTE